MNITGQVKYEITWLLLDACTYLSTNDVLLHKDLYFKNIYI